MKINKKHRKGFTLVELLVVIAIIVALAALSAPAILKQRKKADMIQATSNARQIFATLLDFDQDQGSFPSADTLEELSESDDIPAYDTNNSNGMFSQLIGAGYIDSEEIFYAKGGTKKNRKPDNVYTNADETLEEGENGFGYVMIGDDAMSTSDRSGRPIALAPLSEDGGADGTFNPDPYDNKAVILRLDGSVKSERINKNNRKVKGGSGTILDTGEDSVWGEADEPTVLLPLGLE